MESRVKCSDCGGLNRADAPYCGRCYRRFNGYSQPVQAAPRILVAGSPAHRARFSAAPAPPAAPYAAPPTIPSTGSVHTFESALSQGTLTHGSYKIGGGREPLKWTIGHLMLVGVCAWGLPQLLSQSLSDKQPMGSFLDGALLAQIIGYAVAAAVVALLVHFIQKGDWSTLGIHFSEATYHDLGRGAILGLILLGIWLPIGFVLSKAAGLPMFDGLISTLVGDTSAGGLLLAAVVVVVGAPLIEETYYRGMLYTKLARWNIWLAIVVTSILFVAAHGAILIPPLLLMAFTLAWKRRTESLWYTIGAHAAWNLVIICLAAYTLLGPAKTFSPVDGSYTLRHSADWQRVGALEASLPGAQVDVALKGTGESMIIGGRIELPPIPPQQAAAELLNQFAMQQLPGITIERGHVGSSEMFVEGARLVYELSATLTAADGTQARSRNLLVIPDTSRQAIIFSLACAEPACGQASQDFEKLIRTIRLKGP